MLTFKQFLSEGYIAFVLDPESKAKILEKFPPKFSEVRGDHITYLYGVPRPVSLPSAESVQVVGYASNDVIEAVVVSIDGSTMRTDGEIYHITLSLDSHEGAQAKDSKALVKQGWQKISPIIINAQSQFVI